MTLTRFSKHRIAQVFMCFLCIVLLLFAFSTQPSFQSKAFTGIAVLGGVAIIAMCMVACGMIFYNQDDIIATANHIYRKADSAVQNSLLEVGVVGAGLYTVGSQLWNDIVETIDTTFDLSINKSIQTHYTYNPEIKYSYTNVSSGFFAFHDGFQEYKIGDFLYVEGTSHTYMYPDFTITVSALGSSKFSFVFHFLNGLILEAFLTGNTEENKLNEIFLYPFTASGKNCITVGHKPPYTSQTAFRGATSWTIGGVGVYGGLTGVLNEKDGYVTVGGVATNYPRTQYLLNSDFVYDLFYNNSTLVYGVDKTLSPDLPYVDSETEEVPIAVPNTVEDILTMNPSDVIPKAPPAEPPMDLPDMNLPAYIFTKKFPFCLPWDLYNAFASLVVPPEVPRFEIMLPLSKVGLKDESIDIDFENFSMLGSISRWGLSILFLIALIMSTRKIIGAQ